MSIRALSSINDISADEWDTLWTDYPFTKHAFLSALENTGCTDAHSGWQATHLIFEKESIVVAAFPLYLKSNSWGEYVFDWAWADAYERNGLQYYPKLLCAIPFTPATGPRFGFSKELTDVEKTDIASEFIYFCLDGKNIKQASGLHLLFPQTKDLKLLHNTNLLQRYGYQFHWFNRSYSNFDDFLSTFSSRKRKNIKREREGVRQANLEIVIEGGPQISNERWQTFFIFYHTTYLKRSGRYGYLNQEFFQQLAQALPEQVVLVSALRENSPVAMALYFRDKTTLYGRYWGCSEDIDYLHFELCYYQGIEYAIKHKLQRFDPGAQGEHKIQRGFTPVYTCSYHFLRDSRFQQAVAKFLQEENHHLQHYMQEARAALPFKEGVTLVDENILLHSVVSNSN